MNHLKHYLRLIRKAQQRGWTKKTAPCYVEEHHVFPVKIFGDNNFTVCLTAREHYIAHAILALGLERRYGIADQRTIWMMYAFDQMGSCTGSPTKEYYYSSGLYQLAKKRFSEIHSEVMKGENNPMFGTMWITNGHTNKRIDKGTEIPEGWYKGRHSPWLKGPRDSSNHPRTKTCLGNKWYNNGIDSIQIRPNDSVPEGYYHGRIMNWETSNGKIHITNGFENKQVLLESQIPDGWRKGMTKKGESPGKGTIWITDGKVNKRIPKDQQIPHGFEKGVTRGVVK
jgi:hypothetical protein